MKIKNINEWKKQILVGFFPIPSKKNVFFLSGTNKIIRKFQAKNFAEEYPEKSIYNRRNENNNNNKTEPE